MTLYQFLLISRSGNIIGKLNLITISIAICYFLCACKKYIAPSNNNTDAIYTSSCSVERINWLPDNESVILESHCGSNQYIINTTTKAERTWTVAPLTPQNHYSTPEIPGKLFFISAVPSQLGFPFRLYALNLSDLSSTLIKDSLTENPYAGYYFFSGKKFAVRQSNTETYVINLETGLNQVITNNGELQGWSTDNTHHW
jgi:hypothetical protein